LGYYNPGYVLEKNPPKQGLKRKNNWIKNCSFQCFREKSTKTRIETWNITKDSTNIITVLEKNPPKQGLKRRKRS